MFIAISSQENPVAKYPTKLLNKHSYYDEKSLQSFFFSITYSHLSVNIVDRFRLITFVFIFLGEWRLS